MTAQELELITTFAREDLTRLLKEYARAGHKAAHGRRDEEFEVLWSQVFDCDPDEEKPRN